MRSWEPRTYRPVRPKRHRRLLWLLILLTLAGVAGYFFVLNKEAQTPGDQNAAPPASFSEEIDSVVGKYLFSGTVVIARAVENEARTASGIDYNQPFSKFSTFNPSQYDAWEFDHECPMTMNNIPYRTQVTNTIFNCRPEFLPAMLKHFPKTIANVANNHTRDMGEDGFAETVELLEKGGLQTVGNYSPRVHDDICEVIALPVRLQKPGGQEEKGTLPVAFCAFHYFEYDPEPAEFEVMERFAKVMPVFAFMQVGTEYQSRADTKQVRVGRGLIDTGAPEFVIGNSPHWVQNTEVYKGKLIVYSTGNFIFDQLDAETNRGLSIDIEMTIPYDANVARWLELGEKCDPRGDNCLETAESQGLKKVGLELKYQAVGSSTGYREITQRADSALQQLIEDRANWLNTLRELGQE